MKRSLWMMILFSLTGILCAQLLGGDFFSTYGYLGEYQLQSFAGGSLNWLDLFWNILWGRCKLLLAFVLVCSTSMKRMLPVAARLSAGFLLGFFAAACVIQMGGVGLLFLILCLFPHMPCYLMACREIFRWKPAYDGNGKRKNFPFFLSVLRISLLCLAGCVSETFIGTRLLCALLSLVYTKLT